MATETPLPTPSGKRVFLEYFWFILKNVIGWVLILLAFALGWLPGPGGIPLFLIGFALISFPGKRKFTSRILRGRPLRPSTKTAALVLAAAAMLLPAVLLLLLDSRVGWVDRAPEHGPFTFLGVYLMVAVIAALVLRGAWPLVNWLVRLMPRARRKVRPWLRHHHIRLLPPRRRRRLPHEPGAGPLPLDDEILRIHRPVPPPSDLH